MSSNIIEMIQRQTTYSEEEIKEKLILHNNNVEKIILEYNNFQPKNDEKIISTNQNIFKAIRDNFDNYNK
uniref:Uncharacterized protein n=1 Tax=Florenciella sp. virus SA2 TaxID=3240092 RepID=A0AB39J7H4_9VIRU